MTDTSARFALPHILPGQAQKELYHNEALALIDAALHPIVESLGDDVPPSTPTVGQCWVTGSAPSGAWSGQPDRLAVYTAGGWRFVTPLEGMHVWLRSAGEYSRRTDSGWIDGELTGASLVLGGVQVVGAQQAAIADVAGGGTVDSEARDAIAAIFSALRAHGLIAS